MKHKSITKLVEKSVLHSSFDRNYICKCPRLSPQVLHVCLENSGALQGFGYLACSSLVVVAPLWIGFVFCGALMVVGTISWRQINWLI